jgi:hypothetical protein
MPRIAKVLSAGIIVSGILSGIALTSSPAEAKVTKEERALLKKTVAECKAEAKDKRLKWRERQKWVRSCVTVKLEKHPGVNVQELLRTYPDFENMPKADVRNPV